MDIERKGSGLAIERAINTAKWTGTSVPRDSTYVSFFFFFSTPPVHDEQTLLPLAFHTLMSPYKFPADVSDRVPPDFSRMAESR